MSPGGAARRWKFHAGAWLTPSARFRWCSLSRPHAFADAGLRIRRSTLGHSYARYKPKSGGGSFSRSWLYSRVFEKGYQIFETHFFLIHIWYSDHKSREGCSKYHFQKVPGLFFLSEGVSEPIIHLFSGLMGSKSVEQPGHFFELTFPHNYFRFGISASNGDEKKMDLVNLRLNLV